MQSFKEYLKESQDIYFAPWQGKDGIMYDFYMQSRQLCKPNKDGSFSSSKVDFTVSPIKLDDGQVVIPVKFKTVKDFRMSLNSNITSLWGCPDIVNNDMEIQSAQLKTLEHLNAKVKYRFILNSPKLETCGNAKIECTQCYLDDIGKMTLKDVLSHISVDTLLSISHKHLFRKPILSLCKIPRGVIIKIASADSGQTKVVFTEMNKVLSIVNANRGDILTCQEELIEAGFKNYAKF